MKSKIDYYTRQFLDIYRQELRKIGFEKESAAEQAMVAVLTASVARFAEEAKGK